jgi:WD40 repeat protein
MIAAGKQLVILDWPALTEYAVLRSACDNFSASCFSPDGRWVAASEVNSGRITVWDWFERKEYCRIDAHSMILAGLAFHPSEPRLLSGGRDQSIKVWDLENVQEILTLYGHQHTVRALAFAPDGYKMVSASEDGTARIWDGTPWRPE